MLKAHPLFEIVTTTAGAISIRNKDLNEIMHNPVGPWKEANALYIEPSKFRTELLKPTADEFVVFDVGLGAAANSMAALQNHRMLGSAARTLRLVSFERELGLLRFALDHADQFEHFRGFEAAMETLLRQGEWHGDNVHWHLRTGNFLDLMPQETFKADLIFYDPYSMAVNPEMWTVRCFAELRKLCKDSEDGGTLLLNYSRATPFRTALLMAGFYIGQGPETGLKPETTQAASCLSRLSEPFGARWLDRWKRSHSRIPPGNTAADESWIEAKIMTHPQFKLL